MVRQIIKTIIPIDILRKTKAYINQFSINRWGRVNILPFDKMRFPYGINIIGPIRSETGLGEGCRLVVKEIQKVGVPYVIKNFSIDRNRGMQKDFSKKIPYGINLIQVNMHEFVYVLKELGLKNLDRHYNIAFWSWESELFPKEWIPLINVVDEIWTPSEFTSNSIRKVTDKTVVTIPYDIRIEKKVFFDRAYFELPINKFLFLMLFDTNSIAQRKNPMAVINAFKEAFPNGNDKVGLIIKMNHATKKEINDIRRQLEGYNIYFINRMMNKEEVNRLVELSDVYISLHRAEGFGLVLAEAMVQKVPTIATAYSSNLEFQDEENACLVDYELIDVGKGLWPYHETSKWAEADVKHAASFMKRLFLDRVYYKKIQDCAYRDMTNPYRSVEIQNLILDRIRKVYGE